VDNSYKIEINFDTLTAPLSIPRFIRSEIFIRINGSEKTPDLPLIGSTNVGFISFEVVSDQIIHST
jgi:hypothetical protein